MSCPKRAPDRMEQYLLGRLSDSDRESFERHLFECPQCAAELEELESIREALRRVDPEPAAVDAGSRRWVVWSVAAAAAVGGIAVGLWVSERRSPGVASAPPEVSETAPTDEPATVPPEVRPPSTPGPTARLLAMAEIRPPSYRPPVLRGGSGDSEAAFRAAMRPYLDGDYAAAVAALRPVAEQAPVDARPTFYLGASYLLLGELEEGITHLRKVVALGDTPHLEAAHLLLAKASIKRGEMDQAARNLRAVVALEGDFESEARALLGALEGEGRR